MSVHISSTELTRVLIQYLKEAGHVKTALTLAEETGVFLNCADFPAQLQLDIRNGKWERALKELQHLDLPTELVQEIFEQIFLDLLEQGGERDELMPFLDQAAPFATEGLRRHKFLEMFNDRSAIPSAGQRKEKRRVLAEQVGAFLLTHKLESGRLVSLLEELGRAKNPGLIGMHLNLITGELEPLTQSSPLTELVKTIEFPTTTEISAVGFSPDGRHLIFGSQDGLIEFYNTRTFELDETSVAHQKSGDFFYHEYPITALSTHGDFVVSGDVEGHVKLWSVKRGVLVTENAPFQQEILSLEFVSDGGQVLAMTCERAKVLRVPDLQEIENYCLLSSPKFTCGVVSCDKFFAGGPGGWIYVFDRNGTAGLKQLKPPVPSALNPDETRLVTQLQLLKNGNVLVLTRGGFLSEITQDGKFVNLYVNEERSANYRGFVLGKKLLYVRGDAEGKPKLWVLDADTGKIIQQVTLTGAGSARLSLHGQELMLAVPVGANKIQILK